MGQIYSRASKVIVWLGEEQATDRWGFELIKHMSKATAPGFQQRIKEFRRRATATGSWNPDTNAFGELVKEMADQVGGGILKLSGSCSTLDAVNRILHRPWFNRVWIIQEYLSAKKCVMRLGRLEIEADGVLRVALAWRGLEIKMTPNVWSRESTSESLSN